MNDRLHNPKRDVASEIAQRIQRLKRMQVVLRNEHSANLRAARR